jgi:hypothetical protein
MAKRTYDAIQRKYIGLYYSTKSAIKMGLVEAKLGWRQYLQGKKTVSFADRAKARGGFLASLAGLTDLPEVAPF